LWRKVLGSRTRRTSGGQGQVVLGQTRRKSPSVGENQEDRLGVHQIRPKIVLRPMAKRLEIWYNVGISNSHSCSRRICGTVAPQAIRCWAAGLQIQQEQSAIY